MTEHPARLHPNASLSSLMLGESHRPSCEFPLHVIPPELLSQFHRGIVSERFLSLVVLLNHGIIQKSHDLTAMYRGPASKHGPFLNEDLAMCF